MKHFASRSQIRCFVTALCLIAAVPILSLNEVTAVAASSTVAPCRGSNLWGAYIDTGAATGNYIYNIALINVGHTTCRLSGYPAILGSRNGHSYNLHLARHGTFAGNLAPTVLTPRMSGKLILSTANNCNALNSGGLANIPKVAAANTYSNLTLKLPNSAGDVYLSGFKVDIACGLDVSRLGWNLSN
jgi:hypothetical protein